MAIHRRALEHHLTAEDPKSYATYVRCLTDTFGPDYVAHLERWLIADGGVVDSAAQNGRVS
jgi:hypothetical protein